jgi:hypothetical protein
MKKYNVLLLLLVITNVLIPVFIHGQGEFISTAKEKIVSDFDKHYVWVSKDQMNSVAISSFEVTKTGAVIAIVTTEQLRVMYQQGIQYMILSKDQFEALKTGKPISTLRPTTLPPKRHQKVAMIVDNAAYSICQTRLQTYKQDVESLFNAELTIYPGSWTNAESLRRFIFYLWSYNHITGVIQVGYLPYAMWKFPWGEVCPLPLFHEDMDGSFIDRNQDGYYDWHVWGPNDGPEIWVAYMRPAQGWLSDLLPYLDKCHNYFSDNMLVRKRAEVCVCKDWGTVIPIIRNSLQPIYGDSIHTIGGAGIKVSGQSYLDALARGYEITNVWVHSSPTFHQFDTTPHQYVYESEVRNQSPGSLFTVMWACHGADWHESPTNCFAEAYIFGTSTGLTDLGTTRSIGTEQSEHLFEMLGDSACLTDAYFGYLDILYNSSWIHAQWPSDTVECFVFDIALFGNPFWTPLQTPQTMPWTQATASAAWSARYGHTSLVFNNKMWVMGGWADGFYHVNDVWYSTDGVNWTLATANAGWSARNHLTSVVFDNKMWVMGGHDVSNRSDVWYSTDGVNWTQATANAGWSARYAHTSVVFDNKMWVMGGYDGNHRNDVWYSTDGVNWTQATANAGWAARYVHTSVVFDNKMWVLSGQNTSGNRNDVWYSLNGVTWTQATANAGWSARYSPTSVAFDGKIWVMGGTDDSYNYNDVWYSTNGVNWTQVTANAGWSARYGHTSVVFDNKMWVMGGYYFMNDVWYSPGLSGIEEIEIALPSARNDFVVYPNPARSFFTIRMPLTVDRSQIKIFDVTGKMVKEFKSSGVGELRVPLKGINPGIYFLQLNNKPILKKLAITK